MGRTRDVSKILTSNTSILTLASASATYATKTSTGLNLIVPSTIANTSGTASIGTNGTVSFSAASTVSLNDVFSTTYDKYKILLDVQCSATPEIRLRLRASGSDNSTSNYYFTGYYSFSSDTTIGNDNLYRGDPASAWAIGVGGTNQTAINVDLVSPFLSTYTGYVSQGGAMDSTNEAYSLFINGGFSGTSSFTGLTIFPGSGTFSGSISVYGYNK